MLKKVLSVLAVLALVCALCVPAFAHEVPDLSKTGTIKLTMMYDSEPVGGGELTAIRIGEVYEDDGNYTFRLIGDFAADGAFVEEYSQDLADKMAKIAREKNISGEAKTISADGTVAFSGLELGLYLFVQTKDAEGYYTANPFIMGVPQVKDEVYVYEVDATPKVGVKPEPTTTETTTVPETTIVKTGQLNWPVPVLSFSGIALVAFGIVLCYNGKKETDEE